MTSAAGPSRNASDADLDLLLPLRSAGALEDPYPVYALLRTVRPVMQIPVPGYEGPGVWFLTRYRDVEWALRDPRLSVDRLRAPILRDNLERLPDFVQRAQQGARSLLVMDPPDHTRVRRLVSQAFTPRRVARLRPRLETIADQLLSAVIADRVHGEMDVIRDLAEPFPAIVIAELLGVPAEDHRRFRAWSSALVANLGARDLSQGAAAANALEALLDYLSEVIAARRRAPRDDLISAMIQAQEERDALSDAELLATSNLLLLAGHETTTNLVGNGLLALLREPSALERLRADPAGLPRAIDELLRFDGPVQATLRVALEDLPVGDLRIPAGSLVFVGIGAANHDPEVFAEPDRLDLGRDPNPHLAFGLGPHFCLGSRLALLEAELAIGGLIARLPGLRLVDEAPDRRPNPILRGLRSLPVAW
jgi:cytochrome P450